MFLNFIRMSEEINRQKPIDWLIDELSEYQTIVYGCEARVATN